MKEKINEKELEQVTGGSDEQVQKVFKCRYCDMEFSTEQERDTHEESCEQKPATRFI